MFVCSITIFWYKVRKFLHTKNDFFILFIIINFFFITLHCKNDAIVAQW